jgi:hypothetical protein
MAVTPNLNAAAGGRMFDIRPTSKYSGEASFKTGRATVRKTTYPPDNAAESARLPCPDATGQNGRVHVISTAGL